MSSDRARSLVLGCASARTILDLGCGWGELTLRMLEHNPDARAIAVDTDETLLARGRINATGRGNAGRVEFRHADGASVSGTYELVTCIGATHIWGSRAEALRSLRQLVAPGGVLLFGDGFWQSMPSEPIKEIFGELGDLQSVADDIRAAGFESIESSVADLSEWDEFETRWRAPLEASKDPEVRAYAVERKKEYESGYRGVLGFCYALCK